MFYNSIKHLACDELPTKNKTLPILMILQYLFSKKVLYKGKHKTIEF